MKQLRNKIPPVGMRMIKSAAAVFICFVINMLLGGTRDVIQSTIAACICIQSRMGYSARTGLERIAGTLIGAVFGYLIALLLRFFPHMQALGGLPKYLIISMAVVPVIYTCVLLKFNKSAIMGCVVLFSMTLGSAGNDPVAYALNRVLDTFIGIIVAIGVNYFELPHHHNNGILFISGLDDTLLNMNESLSPYSKIELNRMLSQGAKFTIFTNRTPASLVEVINDIDLNLPVIAMDGAVLYDVRENEYLKLYMISGSTTQKLLSFFEKQDINCFINTFIGEIAVTFCPENMTIAEEKEYLFFRKSPYRQYVKADFPVGHEAVYIYAFADHDTISSITKELYTQDFSKKLKIKVVPSKKLPGNDYLRIYSRNASKSNMIEYLMEYIGVDQVITFGDSASTADIVIHDEDTNKVIKTMKKLYRPLGIKRKK